MDFGIRPEVITLAETRSESVETFQAEVMVREPLGALLLLHCRVGDEVRQVKVEPRSQIQPGE